MSTTPPSDSDIRNAKWFFAATVVWFVVVIVNSSNVARTAPFEVFVVFFGGIFGGICWLYFVGLAVMSVANKAHKMNFIWLILAQTGLFGLGFLANHSDVAFRARFSFSEQALERYVLSQRAGMKTQSSRRVGLFVARETEQLTNCVRIITCSAGMADDAGLVYCPNGRPPRLGEDTYIHLTGPWWRWHRSW